MTEENKQPVKSLLVHNVALKIDDILDTLKNQIKPWIPGEIDPGTELVAEEYLIYAKSHLIEAIEMLNKAANTQE